MNKVLCFMGYVSDAGDGFLSKVLCFYEIYVGRESLYGQCLEDIDVYIGI
jgi:hypothetical protein